jgi:hypothetical protein
MMTKLMSVGLLCVGTLNIACSSETTLRIEGVASVLDSATITIADGGTSKELGRSTFAESPGGGSVLTSAPFAIHDGTRVTVTLRGTAGEIAKQSVVLHPTRGANILVEIDRGVHSTCLCPDAHSTLIAQGSQQVPGELLWVSVVSADAHVF